MKAIKKLKEHKIFGEDSIVETFIEKHLWGTPFFKKARLRVKMQKMNIVFVKNLVKLTVKHTK